MGTHSNIFAVLLLLEIFFNKSLTEHNDCNSSCLASEDFNIITLLFKDIDNRAKHLIENVLNAIASFIIRVGRTKLHCVIGFKDIDKQPICLLLLQL